MAMLQMLNDLDYILNDENNFLVYTFFIKFVQYKAYTKDSKMY